MQVRAAPNGGRGEAGADQDGRRDEDTAGGDTAEIRLPRRLRWDDSAAAGVEQCLSGGVDRVNDRVNGDRVDRANGGSGGRRWTEQQRTQEPDTRPAQSQARDGR